MTRIVTAVTNSPAQAAAAAAMARVIAQGPNAKVEAELPSIDFDGKLVRPTNGKYKCPYRCQTSGFPAQSWKTEKGFRKHMETCTCSPSARERKAANDVALADDARTKCETAAAALGLKVGTKVFYMGYTVTQPTHQNRFGRLVRVRYEEVRSYYGADVTIQSFAWAGGLVINGRVAVRDLCASLAEAQAKAKAAQLQYDSHVEMAAACR